VLPDLIDATTEPLAVASFLTSMRLFVHPPAHGGIGRRIAITELEYRVSAPLRCGTPSVAAEAICRDIVDGSRPAWAADIAGGQSSFLTVTWRRLLKRQGR
jgi:hypothetical protein